MQQITISGTLCNDAERCKDKNGNTYMRFKVACGDTDLNGRMIYTYYHCTCYISGLETLKRGDQVFITGKLSAKVNISPKDGYPYLNLNVMVYQASSGYKLEDREKKRKPMQA